MTEHYVSLVLKVESDEYGTVPTGIIATASTLDKDQLTFMAEELDRHIIRDLGQDLREELLKLAEKKGD